MDDGGSQIVAGLILLTIFLVLEFILTAFLSALDTVSESDIKEKDDKSRMAFENQGQS